METCPPISDSTLVESLDALTARDQWTFQEWSARDSAHGLFQYPAMMVPQMQRELLGELRRASSDGRLYDPFVGSGTTLAEAMIQGLDFLGVDVNPLAVLLCRAKAGPYFIDAIAAAGERVISSASSDRGRRIEVEWPGWKKWFRSDAAHSLSKLRRSISSEPNIHCRRFLWVCLAETVRLTSNSRTSTVKLHTRTAADIRSRSIDPKATFRRILDRNLHRFSEYRDELRAHDLLSRGGYYRGNVDLHLHDASSGPAPSGDAGSCSLLLTSPPYGDNATTVPYGQASFLPLHWIDLADIDDSCDERFLASTHAIDSMSLGAPLRGALESVAPLRASSSSLDTTLFELEALPRDRQQRVAAFWRDLDTSLDHILVSLDSEALMAWTVGNRRVGQRQIPMDCILGELLNSRGCRPLAVIERQIPDCRKRMASRNSVAATMNAEKVLVLRGPSGSDG